MSDNSLQARLVRRDKIAPPQGPVGSVADKAKASNTGPSTARPGGKPTTSTSSTGSSSLFGGGAGNGSIGRGGSRPITGSSLALQGKFEASRCAPEAGAGRLNAGGNGGRAGTVPSLNTNSQAVSTQANKQTSPAVRPVTPTAARGTKAPWARPNSGPSNFKVNG